MKNLYYVCILSLLLFWIPETSIGSESIPYSDKEDIYEYMSKILAPDEHGHEGILDEDIVVYASKLYFEGKHLESIKILKKVHLDHDSIYWLWKNEIAICDALVNLNKGDKSYRPFKDYVAKNTSYFTWDKTFNRYFPNKKRLEESKAVYPKNEFFPEMQIYYSNLEKAKELKLKK